MKTPTVIPQIFPYKGYDKIHHGATPKPPAPEDPVELEQAVADAMVTVMQGTHLPLDVVLGNLKRSIPFEIDAEVLKEQVLAISTKYREGGGPDTAPYEPPKPPVVVAPPVEEPIEEPIEEPAVIKG